MPERQIVTGQKVDKEKGQRAKDLRREMTEEERLLWEHLRANRLKGFHFRRQQIIDGFIVDFYCHKARLVVEVDGPIHEGQADYDKERDRVLSFRGLHILRIQNEDIREEPSKVVSLIVKFLT